MNHIKICDYYYVHNDVPCIRNFSVDQSVINKSALNLIITQEKKKKRAKIKQSMFSTRGTIDFVYERHPSRICLPKLLFLFALPASHIIIPATTRMKGIMKTTVNSLTGKISRVLNGVINCFNMISWLVSLTSCWSCWYTQEKFHFWIHLRHCS